MIENNNPQNDNNQPKMPKFNMGWIYAVILITLCVFFFSGGGEALGGDASMSQTATYTKFKQYVEKGYAKSVEVIKQEGIARMYVKPQNVRDVFGKTQQQTGKKPYVKTQYGSLDELTTYLDSAQQRGKVTDVSFDNAKGNFFTDLLWQFGPLALLIFFWIFLMRRMNGGGAGGGVFNIGKSKAKMYEKANEMGITFKDVAGQAGAKQEVEEIVEFLKHPQRYTDLGGKIPKGVLLVGPPGTGKTLLAKAVAGEAGVPFFSMSGSDFVEMFVGVGASRVRDLFQQAKEKAPCIIFIDEIDAIGRARGKNPTMGGNDERENTLNQLLTEMDGFGTNTGVIVLAATNRVEILDSALLRAGRFDRQIHVDLPELSERVAIFKVHMKPLKLDDTVDIEMLARQTPGFSGADIANVCNEAALIAARHNRKEVGKQDFLDAVDRIIGGLEKTSKVMTEDEKRSIAIHEAGHASVSWLLQYANPLVKVTIVPRGQALGAAWYLPEERTITTREQMLDEVCSLLGGRAAEELFVGHVSSGALNDLERVTKRIYGMVAYLGMSDKLSNVCYYNAQNEYNFTKPYSERTSELIDAEVQRMIAEQYERAKKLLAENANKHNQLADLLVEREVIFTEDVEHIFGPRPWKSRADVLMEEEALKLAEERGKKLEADKQAAAGEEAPTAEKECDNEPAAAGCVPPPVPAGLGKQQDTDNTSSDNNNNE